MTKSTIEAWGDGDLNPIWNDPKMPWDAVGTGPSMVLLFSCRHCISYFPCFCDQIPDKEQLKGSRLYFGSQFQVMQSIMAREAWQHEAADLLQTENREKTGNRLGLWKFKVWPQQPTSSGKAPSPKDSTTFKNATASGRPSAQTYRSRWGKFHFQSTKRNKEINKLYFLQSQSVTTSAHASECVTHLCPDWYLLGTV